MTTGIVATSPPLPTPYPQTGRLQEIASVRAEFYQINYTDEGGRSFNLSLSTETATYAFTYDRSAQVSGGHGRGGTHAADARHGIREDLKKLREELRELERDLKKHGLEVRGFKRLLHRMLKSADQGYRERFRTHDPVEQEIASFEQVHIDVSAVEKSVSVAMDDVDPVYWSAENTAQRLVGFAVSLYRGGDRGEHVQKMVEGMQQGYEEARQAFGGTLPDIAQQTIDLATDKLAKWAGQSTDQPAPLQMAA